MADPSYMIILTPVYDAVITLAVAAIGTAGTVAINRVSAAITAHFNIKVDDTTRMYVQGIFDNALAAASGWARREAAEHGTVATHDAISAMVANYVIKRAPDGLARLGVTPEGVAQIAAAKVAALADRVEKAPAVLQDAQTAPAATGTPPAPSAAPGEALAGAGA